MRIHGYAMKSGFCFQLVLFLFNLQVVPSVLSEDQPYNSSTVILAVVAILKPMPFLEESLLDNFAIFRTYPDVHAEIYVRFKEHHSVVNALKDNLTSQVQSLLIRNLTSESLNVRDVWKRCIYLSCNFTFLIDPIAHLQNQLTLGYLVDHTTDCLTPHLMNEYGHLNYIPRSNVQVFSKSIFDVQMSFYCFMISRKALSELVDATEDTNIFDIVGVDTYTFDLRVSTEMEFGNLIYSWNSKPNKNYSELWELPSNLLEWESRYLHPNYYRTLYLNGPESPCPNVYWIPLFTPRFCREVLAVIKDQQWRIIKLNKIPGMKASKGNDANKDYQINVLDFGESKMLQVLSNFLVKYLSPIQSMVFPWRKSYNFQGYGFFVHYGDGEQVEIGPHVDPEEVSLNVALNQQSENSFDGGIRFLATNCTVSHNRVGWGLFYLNKMNSFNFPHENLKVVNGARYHLLSFMKAGQVH